MIEPKLIKMMMDANKQFNHFVHPSTVASSSTAPATQHHHNQQQQQQFKTQNNNQKQITVDQQQQQQQMNFNGLNPINQMFSNGNLKLGSPHLLQHHSPQPHHHHHHHHHNHQQQQQHSFHAGYKDDKCHVCGDRSTGSHFGGISCESCKAFFRRSVQNNRFMEYKCSYINECKMNTNTRKICQSCRYQVCLDIGMKPKWVLSDSERQQKYGSRRRLKTQKSQSDLISNTSNNNSNHSEMDTSKPSNVQQQQQQQQQQQETPQTDEYPFSASSSSPQNDYDNDIGSTNVPQANIDHTILLEDQYYKNAIDAIDASNLNLTEYEKVLIDKLTFAFYYARKFHTIDMTNLTKKIAELKRGLIIDEKVSKVVLANFMVQPVKRVITFAKLLPDFRKLQLEDQLALLRGSTLEIVICSSLSLFDSQTNSISNVISKDRNIPSDNTANNTENLQLKLELLKFIWPQEVLEGTLKYLKQMKQYSIDEITLLLYLPLVLFAPDRRDLKNRSRILQIQSKYSVVLKKFLLYKFKNDEVAADNLYRILLLKLVDLRDLHELHSSILLGADQSQMELFSQALIRNETEESLLLNKNSNSSCASSSISSLSTSVSSSPFSSSNCFDVATPSTSQTDFDS